VNEAKYACPLCGEQIPPQHRYPRYVCRTCMERAVDKSGNKVELANVSLSGGLRLTAGDTELFDRAANEFPIFIDGVECRAEEARFGGAVIQTHLK
jgi:DNA-directed RNA polymerase subunit RPC12/RpoP